MFTNTEDKCPQNGPSGFGHNQYNDDKNNNTSILKNVHIARSCTLFERYSFKEVNKATGSFGPFSLKMWIQLFKYSQLLQLCEEGVFTLLYTLEMINTLNHAKPQMHLQRLSAKTQKNSFGCTNL